MTASLGQAIAQKKIFLNLQKRGISPHQPKVREYTSFSYVSFFSSISHDQYLIVSVRIIFERIQKANFPDSL